MPETVLAYTANVSLKDYIEVEIFIDEVLTAADNARDTCDVKHFIPKLRIFLEEELKVRNEALANL